MTVFKGISFIQWTVRQKKSEKIKNNKNDTVCSKKIILYADMTVNEYVMDREIDIAKIDLKNYYI